MAGSQKGKAAANGVWKKTNPPLYQHISSFKPKFQTSVANVAKLRKTVTFSDKLVPNKDAGVLETSILYSQGKDIFEIDCSLPIDSFYSFDSSDNEDGNENGGGNGSSQKQEPVREYGTAFAPVEEKLLRPKWSYQGETVTKMLYLGEVEDNSMIAMASNGSLAWFQEDIPVPVHIMQEYMGPGTSFSSMHSFKGPDYLAISDFALSTDFETVVKSQSNGTEEESILKIVDNSGKPGELLRTLNVPGTTVTHCVRFFDNHTFGTCSDDNILRFWDTRTSGEPLFTLSDPNNGRLTSFDTSPLVETLFATGSDTGIIKLWDIRSVSNASIDLTNRQNGEDPIQNELITLHHSGGDTIVDLQFSQTSPSEFVTVGGTGNVYHWDMEFYFSNFDDDSITDTTENDLDMAAADEIKNRCLKFLHTGGSKRSSTHVGKPNTVSWHPAIDDLFTTVDDDGLISVYKPYAAKEEA